MPIFILLLLSVAFWPFTAKADDSSQGGWLEWQSNNVQLLHGEGFRFDDNTQTTFTFEHADGWKYGDNFFYVDYSFDEPDSINAEFSPRLSLSKMSGYGFSYGIVQDVLISGTLEMGRNFNAYLIGGAVDLDVPGFNFFQINLYNRNNPDVSGSGWQTTWVWSRPFEAVGRNFTFDGYFDYADYEEGTRNFFTQPQLLMDVSDAVSQQDGRVFIGAEWRYWHNLYGIDGVTESVPQAMVKVVF